MAIENFAERSKDKFALVYFFGHSVQVHFSNNSFSHPSLVFYMMLLACLAYFSYTFGHDLLLFFSILMKILMISMQIMQLCNWQYWIEFDYFFSCIP